MWSARHSVERVEGGQDLGQLRGGGVRRRRLVERSGPVGQQCPHPGHPVHIDRPRRAEAPARAASSGRACCTARRQTRRLQAGPRRRVRRGDDPREAAGQQAPLRRLAQAPGVDGQRDVRLGRGPGGQLVVERPMPRLAPPGGPTSGPAAGRARRLRGGPRSPGALLRLCVTIKTIMTVITRPVKPFTSHSRC